MTKGSVDVIINQDVKNNPCCPHGPTILFSRQIKGVGPRRYFACSACRDKKQCQFFLWENQKARYNKSVWDTETANFLSDVNHRKMFIKLNEITSLPSMKRSLCLTCNKFLKEDQKHESHTILKGLTNHDLEHPSEFLPSLDNNKKEAQYHFSQSSVEVIIKIIKQLRYKSIICLGTPRIHEYIKSNCQNLSSILLDIDKRFHNFFGPLEFCWYNMFNHHFFLKEARSIFETYLQSDSGQGLVLITDPPFGGRTEILSATFNKINDEYKKLNKIDKDLPIFWIYPYFMEPQILNSMPNFTMCDYKVEYINHESFHNNTKGRKQGSPVRIFTNVKASLIELPQSDYKYCGICERWVAKENRHCNLCGACTSKNGETYFHCSKCSRCVKPTWKHCNTCKRCAQVDHNCKPLDFTKQCFNCKERGHKKMDCPLLNTESTENVEVQKKSKSLLKAKTQKKVKTARKSKSLVKVKSLEKVKNLNKDKSLEKVKKKKKRRPSTTETGIKKKLKKT